MAASASRRAHGRAPERSGPIMDAAVRSRRPRWPAPREHLARRQDQAVNTFTRSAFRSREAAEEAFVDAPNRTRRRSRSFVRHLPGGRFTPARCATGGNGPRVRAARDAQGRDPGQHQSRNARRRSARDLQTDRRQARRRRQGDGIPGRRPPPRGPWTRPLTRRRQPRSDTIVLARLRAPASAHHEGLSGTVAAPYAIGDHHRPMWAEPWQTRPRGTGFPQGRHFPHRGGPRLEPGPPRRIGLPRR